MANESSVVSVTINLSGGGITRQGFGVPLILSNTGNAWATPELVRSYASLSALAADFPSTTAEYGAASALFAQTYKPSAVMVGKGTHKPTQTKTVALSSVVSGATYKINVYNGGKLWSASYVATGGDTNDSIVAALVAALSPSAWGALTPYVAGNRVTNDSGKVYECTAGGTSAGAGGPTGTGSAIVDGTVTWKYIATPNFTATATGAGGSKVVTATGSSAGQWFALEPLAPVDTTAVSTLMALTDTTTDPGVATDLAAIFGASQAWYALVLLFKSSAILATPSTGAAAWCESNGRLLLASVSDTACATSAFAAGTDVLHALTGLGGSYTAGMWHPRDYEWFDAAKLGYWLPQSPGGDNWRLKSYSGVSPVTLTGTQQTNLLARRAAFYEVIGGLSLDGGAGQVEDGTTWLWIDNRRNLDWYAVNLQADLVDLLVKNNKLPHTDAGLRSIATTIKARNDAGIVAGVISPDVTPTVTVPRASTPNTFDPATRALTGISTSWQLAGAINSMAVTVNVTQ
jgi:hypothetical protein